MSDVAAISTVLTLVGWCYLTLGHGMFWRIEPASLTTLPGSSDLGSSKPGSSDNESWPSVAILVPARDEDLIIRRTLPRLARQDYPGSFQILVIDDHSTDGTSDTVKRIASRFRNVPIHVLRAPPLPGGWSGKLWALHQGVDRLTRDNHGKSIAYWLFTDADIAHPRSSLRHLVQTAREESHDLVSWMAMLDDKRWIDRMLNALFIFFFRMMYPFSRVNDPLSKIAAAAGGCVLLERESFRRSGGLLPIRSAIIDDCALGRQMKQHGSSIHLSLSRQIRSIRPSGGMTGMWHTVTRTACDQLAYRWERLIGCVMAMTILYLWPPLSLLWWETMPWIAIGGMLAWAMMSFVFLPMTRWYSMNPLSIFLLPLGAAFFTLMTIASFYQHGRGHGHRWKDRAYHQD